MKKMQIFQLTGIGQSEIVEVNQPLPGRGEVLIEVKAVVTCPQWDQRLFLQGQNPLDMNVEFPQPLGWPGHEAAGVVVAVGPDVSAFKPGDKVAAIYTRIPEGDDMGLYAPLACVRETDLVLLSEPVDFKAAASYGMLRDIVYSTRLFGNIEGKVAAVTGLGSAGMMAVQVMKSFGAAKIVAIDPDPARRKLVLEMGYAQIAIDPLNEEQAASLAEIGLQIGLDCSGIASSIQMLLDNASQHIIVFGVPHGEVRFGLRHWGGEERKLQGVNINLASQKDNLVALELMEKGHVNAAVVATHPGTFAHYSQAIDLLRNKVAIKVYFTPSAELAFDR